ncbi:molybdenum cofactor biosynthesis protein MoaE [Acidisoma cellulosilytica]|uniref:Molybdopterin synthase catalytic subunit n=1 Tax=Acidisoma cellulosilyticum TaxID=2802395 RepID=A0A964E284_9PROT|nr:molybdenum cofactor biosynthesis protein MoaE [Acidisoma cellulosilyticum]MCB8879151.1 molybdenum cofactor biosynthesis protein MoaE [Acidisoma cellulosilyticum]
MAFIRVGPEDFDLGQEMAALRGEAGDIGAVASFIGIVRGAAGAPITAMTLEHYPGMTERAIARMAAEAEMRFALSACRIIHRTGCIPIAGQIVLVLTAAGHRKAALEATSFLIDWLKVAAPFWKKEHLAGGMERWVDAQAADDSAAARWQSS